MGMRQDTPASAGFLVLGIDAGGTETRWALADPSEEIVAEGHVRGFSAVDLHGPGRGQLLETLKALGDEVLAVGRPVRVHAGLTGSGETNEELLRLIAAALDLPDQAVTVGSDVETAYLDLFTPGEGYMVYAGTGSIAAFIDAQGSLHRAGGHGVIIDDAGGGYWIAREALRHVWRAEDERPGSWRDSALARELFALVGGTDWDDTRQCVYGGSRGDVGRLALAVAKAADRDPAARDILRGAGLELARLARTLIGRFGSRAVALSGRAATLHPLIQEAMREHLPAGTPFDLRASRGEQAAARLALRAVTRPVVPFPKDPEP